MRLVRRVNVDPPAQWDRRGCLEWLDVRELRGPKGRQDPPAAEERRGSLVALGTLQWDLMVLGPKERREMWGPRGLEELQESKGSGARLAWFFKETLAPKETLETGVPLA